MLLKRAITLAFFSQNYRLKLFFYSNWKQLQIFKITKFEFMVTVHYYIAYGQNAPSCDPLNICFLWRMEKRKEETQPGALFYRSP